MAIVYPGLRTFTGRSVVNATPTSADSAATAGDIIDCGGMTICGLGLTTATSDTNYSFRVGHTTGAMRIIGTSSGGPLTFGSTVAAVMPGRAIGFDPAPFFGFRFVQLLVGTSAAPLSPAVTASSNYEVYLTLAGMVK